MKKIAYISLIAIGFAACSEKSDLAAKRKELALLKADEKKLEEKIVGLEKEISKLDTNTKMEVKAKKIGVDTLRIQDFKHFIEVQGQVDAEENVIAIQQMPGIVTQIFVNEGQRVSKGQLLFTTDAATYSKQISIVETQLSLARTAYEKQQRLWDQNIGSEIQVLQAKTNKEALEKQIETLRATIEMSKCKSPINGVVDEVRIKLGDMSAPSQLMPGVRVVNNSRLVIKGKLSDSEIGKLKTGDAVQVNFPDLNKSINSTVSYVGQVIDKQTRTFNIEVKLPNNDANYKPNMMAKLKMNDEVLTKAIVIPTNVIQKSEEGTYVLVAENGLAVKKMIKIGIDYNGNTTVLEGLKEGDQLINFGYTEVVDGQKISQ